WQAGKCAHRLKSLEVGESALPRRQSSRSGTSTRCTLAGLGAPGASRAKSSRRFRITDRRFHSCAAVSVQKRSAAGALASHVQAACTNGAVLSGGISQATGDCQTRLRVAWRLAVGLSDVSGGSELGELRAE